MNLPDEELQNRINSSEEPQGYPESEVKSYQYIFRALRKEPEFRLPGNFAEKIVERVSVKNKTSLSKDPAWLFLGICIPGVIIMYLIAIYVSGLKISLRIPGIPANYWEILLFGIVLLFLVQFIDRKFIRPRYF